MSLNEKFASAWYLTKQAPRKISRAAKRNRWGILNATLAALFIALVYCVYFFLAFYIGMGIIALTGSAILALIGAITGALLIGSLAMKPITYGYLYTSELLRVKDYKAKMAPDRVRVRIVNDEQMRVFVLAP